MFAKYGLDGFGFNKVIKIRGSAVRVDVIDLRGRDAAFSHGQAHGLGQALAVFIRSRDVEGIGRGAEAGHFRVNGGLAGQGGFQRFQKHQAGAFAHDKTIAVFVKGA